MPGSAASRLDASSRRDCCEELHEREVRWSQRRRYPPSLRLRVAVLAYFGVVEKEAPKERPVTDVGGDVAPACGTHAIVRCGHCGVVLWRLLDVKQIAAAFGCTCGQRLRLTRLCASAAGGVAV